jgi:hypothetical protein
MPRSYFFLSFLHPALLRRIDNKLPVRRQESTHQDYLPVCGSRWLLARSVLWQVAMPSASDSGQGGNIPALLAYVTNDPSKEAKQRRQRINEIFQGLNSVLPRIDSLVSRADLAMSDSIIIQAVYIAIGPFFVLEFGSDGKGMKEKNSVALTALGGNTALRGLRLSTLSLIRSVRPTPPSRLT